MRRVVLVLAVTAAVVLSMPSTAMAVPTPPAQPPSGPGGAGYPWSSYVYRVRTFPNYDLNYATV